MAVASFDVEFAVAAFLGGTDRQTLELPAMDADQRKQAKAIVDRFPELSCKTYGLGADRCLHVFRTSAEADRAAPVLPTTSKTSKGPDLSPIGEGSPKWPKDMGGSPNSSNQLPTLLKPAPACQVRNTFIHVDIDQNLDAEDTEAGDDRMNRSMPHDMFRQCLKEELRHMQGQVHVAGGSPGGPANRMKRTAPQSITLPQQPLKAQASPPQKPMAPSPAKRQAMYMPGMSVVIHGLAKLPAFNNKTGIVESYDAATGRYSVRLITPVPGYPRLAKVKADNLKGQATFLSVPPPPAYTPTALDEGSNCFSSAAMPEIPPTPQFWDEPRMMPSLRAWM